MIYVIELTRDVTNPHPDRRSRDWNKLPVIPAGTRFVVKPTRDGFNTIERSDKSYPWEADTHELGKEILAASQKVEPDSPKELARVYGCDYGTDLILETLLKLNRISAADFKAVAVELDRTED